MDKNAIKKYAVWARRELIERVSQRALLYGITAKDAGDPNAESINGHLLSQAEKRQRQALIRNIREKGYEQVMEEVAYTWFNRFAALRFMEVNGYLPSHIRVFTNDEGEFKPQILTEAIHLELDGLDINKVYALEQANKTEELYKYLLIVQCNALNSILPGMFQKIDDYTELLFPDYLLREGSVIEEMVTTIPEEDWTDQVQIIGWLYQYYNTEPKDKVFADLKKNIKITKENIPAATQLFTPDWIVHYMVENSLGRLWLEGHPNAKEKMLPTPEEQTAYIDGNRDKNDPKWHYYLEEAKQEPEVEAQLAEIRKEYAALKPEEIKVIDPCCGSGHILCVLFDVLVRIYEDYGYTAREAASKIVENNLWGLDIDDRAAQLSYFAVMMKARQYDRRFFSRNLQPHVYAIEESNNLSMSAVASLGYHLSELERNTAVMQLEVLHKELYDAKEYGSIINVSELDWDLLRRFATPREEDQLKLSYLSELETCAKLQQLINVGETLFQHYHTVCTNPPYMGFGGFSTKLANRIKADYSDMKSDIYAAFFKRGFTYSKENGYIAMVTPSTWLFLSSFIILRDMVMSMGSIFNLVNLGLHAFESGFGTVAWIYNKSAITLYRGKYISMECIPSERKIKDLHNSLRTYTTNSRMFKTLPNHVFAFWCPKAMKKAFETFPQIKDYYTLEKGISTGKNELFLRTWHEISADSMCQDTIDNHMLNLENIRWFKCNKAGGYEKWYGSYEYVIKMGQNGQYLKKVVSKDVLRLRNPKNYNREAITWPHIGDKKFSCKLLPTDVLNNDAAYGLYTESNKAEYYILGLFNSVVFNYILNMINPTVNYPLDSIGNAPFCKLDNNEKERIETIVLENIKLSKLDWDSFENSWDFQQHPMLPICFEQSDYTYRIEDIYNLWTHECDDRFYRLKGNEEELNRIFIDIYGLQDELTPEVEDKDVTVRKANLQRDIRSFISYAIGCMFGRYSLDVSGLAYAGGDWDATKYRSFQPDADNIIPFCDDEYFEDDVVGRFVKFVEVIYGKDTLEENLQFIADALNGKGTPREIIRDYFINDFYADHCTTYSVTGSGKRPIYWLFDSGKKNGFKCLIYMHRYQPDIIARIRTDYVHEQQSRYRTAIADLEQRINDASTAERVKLNKQLTKLQEQAEELRVYEEKIHHLADQMIKIDLDDGVKVNYAKFEDVLAKIK